MKFGLSSLVASAIFAQLALAGLTPVASRATCTLNASGGDDGPAFVSAVLNTSCSTVEIPSGTTLNISSPLDMTGAQDTQIVSLISDFFVYDSTVLSRTQLLQGTVKFNPDVEFWIAVSCIALLFPRR